MTYKHGGVGGKPIFQGLWDMHCVHNRIDRNRHTRRFYFFTLGATSFQKH